MAPDFLHQPIPGISLTGAPGNAPWEQPPKHTSLDEVVDYYSDRLVDEDMIGNVIDVIKRNVPLLTIAEGMIRAGIMEGMHTIDAGMLVKPVLVEMMIALAEIYGVKYVIQAEDMQTLRSMPIDAIEKVMAEAITEMQEVKEETGGSSLVARRKK
jgi:hypothetical protein